MVEAEHVAGFVRGHGRQIVLGSRIPSRGRIEEEVTGRSVSIDRWRQHADSQVAAQVNSANSDVTEIAVPLNVVIRAGCTGRTERGTVVGGDAEVQIRNGRPTLNPAENLFLPCCGGPATVQRPLKRRGRATDIGPVRHKAECHQFGVRPRTTGWRVQQESGLQAFWWCRYRSFFEVTSPLLRPSILPIAHRFLASMNL